MALIRCPECGNSISDKAAACIHCGYPLQLQTPPISQELPKKEQYSLELIDCGNANAQVANILKQMLHLDPYKALAKTKNLPAFIIENESRSFIDPLMDKLNTLPVEYKLYYETSVMVHKRRYSVTQNGKQQVIGSPNKKIKCPKCKKLIPESSAECEFCGCGDIKRYLLYLEGAKKGTKAYVAKPTTYSTPQKQHTESSKLTCPKCRSTNITTGERGYNIIWGFIGSNRTMNRCANCGYKWEPKFKP